MKRRRLKKSSPQTVQAFSCSPKVGDMMTPALLAPYVLRALAAAQHAGRPTNLQGLAERLKVRRADVRETVSALHMRGLVDACTMRLTLEGFAIGSALRSKRLAPLREVLQQTAANSNTAAA
jgi:DNA-binding Lrp family transcriptional regulator